MKSHELYQMAMPRGAAGKVAREMGYADASIPKSWRRPLATPTNLFTGELSPLMKALVELLAQDRVNPGAADLLIFHLHATVARQRARRGADDEDSILMALISSNQLAVNALLAGNEKDFEEKLYRAGAEIMRALDWAMGDDGQGVPLLRIETKKTLFERLGEWVRGL